MGNSFSHNSATKASKTLPTMTTMTHQPSYQSISTTATASCPKSRQLPRKAVDPPETEPLVCTAQATAVVAAVAPILNESAMQIKKATAGPMTFRTMGLLGGIAMMVSNLVGIIDRFMSFNVSGALIGFYGTLFGFLIVTLEMPNLYCFEGGRMNGGIRWYAKFLEFTWGRGVLYFYVGSLQATNVNILDWAVGGFMMFVGIIAICSGIATARDLRKFKHSIANEYDLKQKWEKYDADGNGTLDAKELTTFVKESGVDMTRNEIASAFLVLDKNFDDKISYEEFYFWWMGEEQKGRHSMTLAV